MAYASNFHAGVILGFAHMAAANTIELQYPKNQSVGHTFLALGRAKGKDLTGVAGEVQSPSGSITGKQVKFKQLGSSHNYRWAILFQNVPQGDATLTVQLLTSTGNIPASPVPIQVRKFTAKLDPGIDNPPSDNYQLTEDDLEYFPVYGPSTVEVNDPITIGPRSAPENYDSGSDYWWAEFTDLGELPSGSYTLTVSKPGGTPTQYTIII